MAEGRISLDLVQSNGLTQRAERAEVNHAKASGRIAGIRIIFAHNFDHPDNLTLINRMIEKTPVTGLHGFQIIGGLEIAYAVPVGNDAFDLVFP